MIVTFVSSWTPEMISLIDSVDRADPLRQLQHLGGDDGEPLSRLSRPGRLDCLPGCRGRPAGLGTGLTPRLRCRDGDLGVTDRYYLLTIS
jgi:hypothetical protein